MQTAIFRNEERLSNKEVVRLFERTLEDSHSFKKIDHK